MKNFINLNFTAEQLQTAGTTVLDKNIPLKLVVDRDAELFVDDRRWATVVFQNRHEFPSTDEELLVSQDDNMLIEADDEGLNIWISVLTEEGLIQYTFDRRFMQEYVTKKVGGEMISLTSYSRKLTLNVEIAGKCFSFSHTGRWEMLSD